MKDVKVTVLRQRLPEYMARVRRGERVRVTSRGQVIAEIAPPSAAKDDAEAARKRLRGSVRRYERPFEPVSAEIAEVAGSFDGAVPGDPADRIIAATAIALGLKLITADKRLRRAPRLQTVW